MSVYLHKKNIIKNFIFYRFKFIYLLCKKPGRIFPHTMSRLAYLFSWLFRGYAGFPHTFYLGISNKCNLQCKMCDLGQKTESVYHHHLSPDKELSLNQWRKLIDEISPYKPAIELSAAEPLLYKDFVPLVKYIKQEKKLECRIYTNGFLLEEYGLFLRDIGINHVIVSIDGPPDTHDYIRGKPGLFDKILKGLKILSHANTARPLIDINYTISNHNYGKIEETFQMLSNNDIAFDRFTIIQTLSISKEAADRHNKEYPLFPVTEICKTGVDFLSIDASILHQQIKNLIRRGQGRVRVYPDFPMSALDIWYNNPNKLVGNTAGCRFVWNSATITSSGNVIPYIRCANKIFGNISADGFKKTWNSKSFRDFRLLSKRVRRFPICSRCSASFMR